jgi:hypothetical protein
MIEHFRRRRTLYIIIITLFLLICAGIWTVNPETLLRVSHLSMRSFTICAAGGGDGGMKAADKPNVINNDWGVSIGLLIIIVGAACVFAGWKADISRRMTDIEKQMDKLVDIHLKKE